MASPMDLKDIARIGGGISIDATKYSPLDLKDIARILKVSGGMLIVRNAHSLSSLDLKDIARIAPKQVIFEI
jgi:hypothetical protein